MKKEVSHTAWVNNSYILPAKIQFLVEFLNPGRPIRSTRKIDVLHATDTLLSQPTLALKVHKRDNFLGFDFEICTFS
jgi:hypothetical protein